MEVVAGRQTLNLGSRRLVARNVFRNTINSFTGGKVRLIDYGHWQFTGFVTMPFVRYPKSSDNILKDKQQFDEVDTHTLFSGGFLEMYDLAFGINSELYLYHMDESDSANNPTRNRRYFTPGMRFYLKPSTSMVDFQLETIGQFGTVRATADSTDNKDVMNQAWMQHVDVGYIVNMPWKPRVAFEYDYVSGDKKSKDNKDQRFDTLFGARRFEFGPTGIYGAFSLTNINSPGYRINFSPREAIQLGINHRTFWLASATDSWVSSGLREKTGKSGDFVGHQLELTARYNFNSSLNGETGWTHIFKKTPPIYPTGKTPTIFINKARFAFKRC